MKLAGAPEEAEAAGKQSTAAKSSPADGGSKEQPGKLAKGSQDTAGGGQQAGARDSSKTVFVRALPADASQDQLHLAFSKFGKLRSCRSAAPLLHPHIAVPVSAETDGRFETKHCSLVASSMPVLCSHQTEHATTCRLVYHGCALWDCLPGA